MKPTSERIDRRYSGDSEAVPWADAWTRLAGAEVAWIVTVRPDGRPHATPMVPVADDGKMYFHTGSAEVKYANLQANSRVLVLAGDTGWDKGLDVAFEGTAVPVTDDATLRRFAELVRERWDGRWQPEVGEGGMVPKRPGTQLVVFEVTPAKALGYAKGDASGQTTYLF
jgi:general stress protein 26